jgi:hypothetical protein
LRNKVKILSFYRGLSQTIILLGLQAVLKLSPTHMVHRARLERRLPLPCVIYNRIQLVLRVHELLELCVSGLSILEHQLLRLTHHLWGIKQVTFLIRH